MKRPALFLILIFFASALFWSCKKTEPSGPQVVIPWDMDTLMSGGVGGRPITTPALGVDGVMTACEKTTLMTDTAGRTYDYIRRWQSAAFTDGKVVINAGDVSVNSVKLPFKSWQLNWYEKHDTAAWDEGGKNHWNVSGSGIIPPFSADIPGTLPSFSGTVPTTVSTKNDFTFTFDASNTVNGERAYVIIYTGDMIYSNNVSATGGTAVIKAAELRNARNGYMDIHGYIPGKTMLPVFYGGYIAVVIYSKVEEVHGDKKFAFVKQRVLLRKITFE